MSRCARGGLARDLTSRCRGIALAFALASAACADARFAESGVPDTQLRRPDVLVVSVDTLRADHVSAYGRTSATTPFLDALAREGIRFSRAYSTSSWTAPALASLLTSSYPSRHGVGQGVGRDGTRAARRWNAIPAALPSLPELFQRAGYRTHAVTANFGLPPERGFARGFDTYECVGAENLDAVRAAAAPWRDALAEGPPWFVWLHLFDPHAPYEARTPWLDAVHPRPRERFDALDGLPANQLPSLAGRLGLAQWQHLRGLYDSEIRAVDEFLREWFEAVPRARAAVFLFVADHGEEFFEHGGVLHGRTLFEEVIRIPFVLRVPGGRFAGTTRDEPVSLVDALPTLVEAAGLELPDALAAPGALAGASLLAAPAAGAPAPARPIVAELLRGARARRAWIDADGDWKYVADTPDAGALYHLASDPGERLDVSADHPERSRRYREALERFADAQESGANAPDTPLTQQQREALEALGYVDSAGVAP